MGRRRRTYPDGLAKAALVHELAWGFSVGWVGGWVGEWVSIYRWIARDTYVPSVSKRVPFSSPYIPRRLIYPRFSKALAPVAET